MSVTYWRMRVHSSLSLPEKLQPSHDLALLGRVQESEPIQDRLGRLKIHKAETEQWHDVRWMLSLGDPNQENSLINMWLTLLEYVGVDLLRWGTELLIQNHNLSEVMRGSTCWQQPPLTFSLFRHMNWIRGAQMCETEHTTVQTCARKMWI